MQNKLWMAAWRMAKPPPHLETSISRQQTLFPVKQLACFAGRCGELTCLKMSTCTFSLKRPPSFQLAASCDITAPPVSATTSAGQFKLPPNILFPFAQSASLTSFYRYIRNFFERNRTPSSSHKRFRNVKKGPYCLWFGGGWWCRLLSVHCWR